MPKYLATNYVRISYADDKSCESDSITNQKKYIEEYVKRNPDIEVVNVRVDDGYSGIVFDRPAFKEMMEDIRSGKINCCKRYNKVYRISPVKYTGFRHKVYKFSP